jgi:nitrogen fixation/metabolism regulation signal transduction histidine kinase
LNPIINAAEPSIRTWADHTAREIRVRLADDGQGMNDKVARRAFEPLSAIKEPAVKART